MHAGETEWFDSSPARFAGDGTREGRRKVISADLLTAKVTARFFNAGKGAY